MRRYDLTKKFLPTYLPPFENTLKERSKGLVAFETLITIPTIENLDSWQSLFTSQLRVTLDSIRNSCGVFHEALPLPHFSKDYCNTEQVLGKLLCQSIWPMKPDGCMSMSIWNHPILATSKSLCQINRDLGMFSFWAWRFFCSKKWFLFKYFTYFIIQPYLSL